jgi:hypothetical protein
MKAWVRQIACLAFAAAAGCGPSLVEVGGDVLLAGAPASSGTVVFAAADGPSASSLIEAGRFSLPKVAPGSYQVNITVQERTGRKVRNPDAPDQAMDEMREYAANHTVEIPPEGTAALRLEVPKGRPSIPFR